MKTKKSKRYPDHPEASGMVLKDEALAELPVNAAVSEDQPMVRTQIYLSQEEHAFLMSESVRRDEPMAAVLRSFVDEKMAVPDKAWTDNPLLAPPVKDPVFNGFRDGAVNHDHYVYGTPKKWMKRKGKWVETPPVPDDYYRNDDAKREYNEDVDKWT